MMSPVFRATLIGLVAPLLWGMSVGLIRGITEDFGITIGLTLLYGACAIYLFAIFGRPHFKAFNPKMLWIGIPLANFSVVCLIYSIGLSEGGQQTLEVGMVNYMWPSMTVLSTVLLNHLPVKWWVVFGFFFSILGITMVLGGENGLDFKLIASHVQDNPWSYLIALIGAVAWATFSGLTRRWGTKENPSALIFFNNFVFFAILWAFDIGVKETIRPMGFVGLLMATFSIGTAYAVWTYGMQKGKPTILAIASYFTPVLSCLFGSFWLSAVLGASFWQGVALVVFGSLICWLATLDKRINFHLHWRKTPH